MSFSFHKNFGVDFLDTFGARVRPVFLGGALVFRFHLTSKTSIFGMGLCLSEKGGFSKLGAKKLPDFLPI